MQNTNTICLLCTYIVQTGKYRKEDSDASEGVTVFKSVVEAIDHIVSQYEKQE